MPVNDSNSSSILGYLTFVQISDHGIVGGYLLVNQRARPIEFHCTAPIKTTRAQQILYGSTLRSELLCDQIGQALLSQTKQKVSLLLTDEPESAGLRQLTSIPFALFANVDVDQCDEPERQGVTETTRPVELATVIPPSGHPKSSTSNKSLIGEDDEVNSEWTFEYAGYQFTNAPEFPEDQEPLRKVLMSVAHGWDLAEPLQRIRAAIQEAQRAAA